MQRFNTPGGDVGNGQRDRKGKESLIPGKVFVGGLSAQVNHLHLEEYCKTWGPVVQAFVMKGKGYGFVTFEDPKNAQDFLGAENHVIDGRRVDTKAAVPKSMGGQHTSNRMFVGGCCGLSEGTLRQYFSKFGKIEEINVIRRADGMPKGYCFIAFDSDVSVEKCLVQSHRIDGVDIYCGRALDKNQAKDEIALRNTPAGMGPGMMGPGMMAPGMTMPGMTMPGMMAPGMMAPGMMGPGMMGPGMMGPGMMGPGMMGPGMAMPGPGMEYRDRKVVENERNSHKKIDWNCVECGAKNYGWRTSCHRCKISAPKMSHAGLHHENAGMALAMMGTNMMTPAMMPNMMGGMIGTHPNMMPQFPAGTTGIQGINMNPPSMNMNRPDMNMNRSHMMGMRPGNMHQRNDLGGNNNRNHGGLRTKGNQDSDMPSRFRPY